MEEQLQTTRCKVEGQELWWSRFKTVLVKIYEYI